MSSDRYNTLATVIAALAVIVAVLQWRTLDAQRRDALEQREALKIDYQSALNKRDLAFASVQRQLDKRINDLERKNTTLNTRLATKDRLIEVLAESVAAYDRKKSSQRNSSLAVHQHQPATIPVALRAQAAILGKWKCTDDSAFVLEFYVDSTFVQRSAAGVVNGTYELLAGHRIHLVTKGALWGTNDEFYDYVVQANSLTIHMQHSDQKRDYSRMPV